MTTRNESVASITTGQNCYLPNLPHEDCWQLFVQHAFGINIDLNAYPDFQAIARKIVNKCKLRPSVSNKISWWSIALQKKSKKMGKHT